MRHLLVIGASGHGKVVADIAKNNGYLTIDFLDDNIELKNCGGYDVLGTTADMGKYPGSDVIVAIGNSYVRERIIKKLLHENQNLVTLIHPNAVIAENVSIGTGTVVMAGAVINPNVVIGRGCIINTSSSVDHDCRIADYTHVSVGAHVCGTVDIGKNCWIGAGATISNNITVCDNCMIGAGAVVIDNIYEAGTYVGVPAIKKESIRGGG